MSVSRLKKVLILVAFAGMALGRGNLFAEDAPAKKNRSPEPGAADVKFFQQQVQPLLKAKCLKCHGGEGEVKGDLRLTSRKAVLLGGELGPAVLLDNLKESPLLQAINYEELEMPPKGKLPNEEIAILTRWVKRGLPWTPGEEDADDEPTKKNNSPQVNEVTKNHWSFRPVVRPALPAVKQQAWVRNPIDAFVLARLEAAGLKPAKPAARAALLRRAYYDLIGLPPSPEEVDAFLADKNEDAFEEIVDRLLESPQYGERWARHWLDLVRYAETNSYERDDPKPFVWRYRDYVIRALNQDKPYDRFIIEQLAGDELENVAPETIIATGFYRLGIWDDEPSDRPQALYDDLDDILTTTAQGFLGLTVNCCRCHDHKLDPIPQKDYYRMLAFFSGLNRFGVRSGDTVARFSLRSIASEEERRRQQIEIAAHKSVLDEVNEKLAAIEKIVKKDFQPVEFEEFKHRQHRVHLVKMRVPKLISQKQFEQYEQLTQQQDKLNKVRPSSLSQALCVTEIGSEARETHVLIRGSARSKGVKVEPGFPSIFSTPDPKIPNQPSEAKTSGRRLHLARWIASEENPLTARVIVNRIWQHHFGRGIVRTPNNFGLQGFAPTHPQLLDWLACEFTAGRWKMKRLHKLIMMSNTYQLSSRTDVKTIEADPLNDLLGRFEMRRLAAEEIRDSILAVNGSLNPKMFGPSIYPTIPQAVLAGQSRPGSGWGESSSEDRVRRSIYIHIKRSLGVPVLTNFDAADTDTTCPVRFATTQPTQALGMMNGEFLNRQSKVFADYLRKNAGENTKAQVKLGLRRTLQRSPSAEEIERASDLIDSLQKRHDVSSEKALDYFCLVLLNLNEFIYLD